jgi:hypothetical protein
MSRASDLHSLAFVMPELAAYLPNGGTKVNVLFCCCEPNLHVGAANRTPSTELPSAARLPLLSLTSVSSTRSEGLFHRAYLEWGSSPLNPILR